MARSQYVPIDKLTRHSQVRDYETVIIKTAMDFEWKIHIVDDVRTVVYHINPVKEYLIKWKRMPSHLYRYKLKTTKKKVLINE